jgi:hypothetical protein
MREGLQRVPSHPTLVKNKAGSDTESGDENVLISVTDDKVAGTHLGRHIHSCTGAGALMFAL